MITFKARVTAAAVASAALLATGIGLIATSDGEQPTADGTAAAPSAAAGRPALPTFTVPTADAGAEPAPTAGENGDDDDEQGSGTSSSGGGAATPARPVPTQAPVPTVAAPAPQPSQVAPRPTAGPPPVTPGPQTPVYPTPDVPPVATVAPTVAPTDDPLPPDAVTAPPGDYSYPIEICQVIDTDALADVLGTQVWPTADTFQGGYCDLSTGDPEDTDTSAAGPQQGLTAMVQPADSPFILNQLKYSTPLAQTPGTGVAYAAQFDDDVWFYTWVDGQYAVSIATRKIADDVRENAALPVARDLLDHLVATAPEHPTFPDPKAAPPTGSDTGTIGVAVAGTGAAGLLALPLAWAYRRRRSAS